MILSRVKLASFSNFQATSIHPLAAGGCGWNVNRKSCESHFTAFSFFLLFDSRKSDVVKRVKNLELDTIKKTISRLYKILVKPSIPSFQFCILVKGFATSLNYFTTRKSSIKRIQIWCVGGTFGVRPSVGRRRFSGWSSYTLLLWSRSSPGPNHLLLKKLPLMIPYATLANFCRCTMGLRRGKGGNSSAGNYPRIKEKSIPNCGFWAKWDAIKNEDYPGEKRVGTDLFMIGQQQ